MIKDNTKQRASCHKSHDSDSYTMESNTEPQFTEPEATSTSASVKAKQAEGGSIALTLKAMRYYDIMIIGRSGMGKTTTTEKLLVANPDGFNYVSQYPSYLNVEELGKEGSKHIKHQDLCMWKIPEDKDAIERLTERLKLLTFFRATTTDSLPHQSINKARAEASERTQVPELFSNEKTKLRVLDARGFFGPASTNEQNPNQVGRSSHPFTTTAMNANLAHLGTMRSILHIQTSMSMKFSRILYFLPCRGTLEASSAPLIEELQLLHYFFGRSIFETMVIVATLGRIHYKMFSEHDARINFPEDELDKSRETIQEELKKLMPNETPQPPVIFISQNETCESILAKVKGTQVARNSLCLQLKSTVCARCSATIGEKKSERIASTDQNDWAKSMIYEESHCHPLMVPRYSRIQKIVEGIAYVVRTVVRRNSGNRPDFSAEKCIECGCPPGSLGCWRVYTNYIIEGETYVVNHNNRVQECAISSHQALIQEESADEPSNSPPPSPNPEDIPSEVPRDGDNRAVQSDALVFGTRPRKQKTSQIRHSTSLYSVASPQPDSLPTPLPRKSRPQSTATMDIVPALESLKNADTAITYGGEEGWEERVTPSDIDEYVYQQEVAVEVNSLQPSLPDERRYDPDSLSNNSSKKGT